MITVASYLMGIPPGNSNPEKPAIINNFIQGVNAVGDKGAVVTGWHPMDTDVAVIQGFVHHNSKNTRHLMLRKAVYDNQINRGKRCLIVDSNLFLYKDKTNNGKNILICCQRDGGWSMDGEGVVTWLMKTISELRKYTDRPVVIRFHPGDKRVAGHIKQIAGYRIPKVSWSMADTIQEDFANSYAVINFNSSPAVASVIEGLPTFQLDAGRSQAKGVVHTSLAEIERPQEFARETWLQKLAQCHWTLEELKTGEAWAHLKKYAIKD